MRLIDSYKEVSLIAVLVLLLGCKAQQELPSPKEIPEAYEAIQQELTLDSSSIATLHWSRFFQDERLARLIQIGLENNQDVLKTNEKVRVAKASLQQARLGRLPEFNAGIGAMARRFGHYTMDGVGNDDSNLSPTVPEDRRIPAPYRDFMVGVDFSWELDIWGRLNMEKSQALNRFLASEEMVSFTQTQLVAAIAEQYFQMLGLEEEIQILNKNIALQVETFELGKSLKASGEESQLSIDQFEGLMLNSRNLLKQKERMLQSSRFQLYRLLGTYPFELEMAPWEETEEVPEILAIGLPAHLLKFRPDIRRAEKELIAQQLEVDIAHTAFFPTFRLYGMGGFNAFELSKLFLAPLSSVYQLAGGLTAPVFNRGRIKAAYEGAKASQKVALLEYEQVVQSGYLEVLDLVNGYVYLEEQVEIKDQEVLVQQRSVENASTMFRLGYADYLDLINAQSRLLEAELETVQLKVEQLANYSTLYRALGGGWIL